MADFTLVDPKGWEHDLHSIYAAYIGYFQTHNVPWYDRTWGYLFESFDTFLSFSWPVITATDTSSGKAHIVTRLTSLGAFLKMIKTRFGETLPQPPNIIQIVPFETTNRHLRHVSDYAMFKKVYSTLPAAVLSALKARVKGGVPRAVQDLWENKDKTFLAIDFEWNERNDRTILEFGYAAVRCGHLGSLGHWPPNPDSNYRKGHYIIAEHVDKVTNKYSPTYPWQYAFGDSQVVSKTKLPQIVQAIMSSLASAEAETSANTLVLVGHNIQGDLARLDDLKIKLPHNMLILDTMILERNMYANGWRGVMLDPKAGDKPRQAGSSLSLEHLLLSFTVPLSPTSTAGPSPSKRRQTPIALPQCTLHNSGNDSMMTLFALQKLLEPTTGSPSISKKATAKTNGMALPMPMMPMAMPFMIPTNNMSLLSVNGVGRPGSAPRAASSYDLAAEFGQMSVESSGYKGSFNGHLSAGRDQAAKRFNSFPGPTGTAKGG
ncbi:hypothetical protein CPB83DRAFT_854937 [Crepidotus variabilis]|uniref:Gfd2/YDR514C-like C-terminal domain-containing protein n=1 Tax=Crepidotus variabilis TaxID=179855 RepID=A0A9P6JPW8_9AGAR|nr:hypothetical protein CPB83DRAFT_854937 [Crepidotus variabilis]